MGSMARATTPKSAFTSESDKIFTTSQVKPLFKLLKTPQTPSNPFVPAYRVDGDEGSIEIERTYQSFELKGPKGFQVALAADAPRNNTAKASGTRPDRSPRTKLSCIRYLILQDATCS